MPDTLTLRRWAVFEDEDGAFMVVTEAEGDYITMPDMDAERCGAVVAEHNDALAHIDAVTAAVRAALNELGVPGEGYPVPVANAVRILSDAILRGEQGAFDVGDPAVREAQVYGGDDRARQVDEWTDPKG